MKKFYQFTLATATIFAFVMGFSHLAFAQGKVNIKGGPLKEADWLAKSQGSRIERRPFEEQKLDHEVLRP